MRIHLLGTSAGSPDPDRAPTSILVEGVDQGLLIDAGDGVARTLVRGRYRDIRIRSVLLTHNHADHVSGLPFLVQHWKGSGKRREPLEVLCPAGLGMALERWLSALRMPPDRLPFALEFRQLTAGEWTSASGHRLDAWETDHFEGDGSEDHCFGVTLKDPGGDWIFSSDLKSLKPLESRLNGVHGLIVESAHVDPKRAVRMAKKRGVHQIVLTHVPLGRETPKIDGAVWAEDGMILETGHTGEK